MILEKRELSSCAFRDLAQGIQQQMYFWGQDVHHSDGNLLMLDGFQKSPSTGIKGTSCYKRPWKNGHIELYGSCAGWYGKEGGFTFIRPWKKCVIWNSATKTPIPGNWDRSLVKRNTNRTDLHEASKPFLEWLLSYEKFVLEKCGHTYRTEHYKSYRKVPKAKFWLSPDLAFQWIEHFLYSPETVPRPKHFQKKSA